MMHAHHPPLIALHDLVLTAQALCRRAHERGCSTIEAVVFENQSRLPGLCQIARSEAAGMVHVAVINVGGSPALPTGSIEELCSRVLRMLNLPPQDVTFWEADRHETGGRVDLHRVSFHANSGGQLNSPDWTSDVPPGPLRRRIELAFEIQDEVLAEGLTGTSDDLG